ncbi:hypothetical protein GCM10023094_29210 [Rhodococcus olei]|uniref:Uncharacterized protein n=1 Tax=Rhodococcus olei TaxID=2161675 RepID=A0ABP8P605_9NOCA
MARPVSATVGSEVTPARKPLPPDLPGWDPRGRIERTNPTEVSHLLRLGGSSDPSRGPARGSLELTPLESAAAITDFIRGVLNGSVTFS